MRAIQQVPQLAITIHREATAGIKLTSESLIERP
jgi:hypothetical protein